MSGNRFGERKQANAAIDMTTPEALTLVPAKEESVSPPKQETSTKDILASLKPEPKSKAKSYGFYLDDEAVDALEQLAKENKTNRSKILNTLLRKMLL